MGAKNILASDIKKIQYTDPNTLRVFVYIQLEKNSSTNSLVTTTSKIAQDLNLSRQKTRTSLKKLEANELVTNNKKGNNLIISTKTRDTKITSNQPATSQQPALFDEFWAVYPKKQSKEKARQSFLKLNVTQDILSTMLVAIENQKQSEQWKKEKGQYIPLPSTWLNQKRWEDETSVNLTAQKIEGLEGLNGEFNNDF